MDLVEQINSNNFLFLDKIIDDESNSLILFISSGRADKSKSVEILDTGFEGNPIVTDELCDKYKVTFENYVAYSITNESYTVWDDYDEFDGKLFRRYYKSRYLDYLPNSLVIDLVHEIVGKPIHYGICCEYHIIDIAISGEPKIEILD